MNQNPGSNMLAVPVTQLDHMLGTTTARVTLVEFGDFECPNCGQAYPAVKILRKHFGENMRFVFRHFPLREVHPHAELAAEAAEAAGAQGRFWPMLTEVDYISAISGGAVVAAYYGLYRDRIFDDFGRKFLYRDVQSELIDALVLNLYTLTSPRFGRSDIFAEYLDRNLFEGMARARSSAASRTGIRNAIFIHRLPATVVNTALRRK